MADKINIELHLVDDPDYPAEGRLIQKMRDRFRAIMYIEKGTTEFNLITTKEFSHQAQTWAEGCLERLFDGTGTDFWELKPGIICAVFGAQVVPKVEDPPPEFPLIDPQIPPLTDR